MSRDAPPTLPPPRDARLPPIHHARAGDLDAFIVERHDLPVVDVRLVVRAGASHDPAHLAGRAFLTADLLDEGTTSRDALAIAAATELLGASMATRATWDFCSAALHVLAPRLRDALDLLADVLTRPTFPDDELQRRRAERLAAILQEKSDPRVLASQAFVHTLYGERHPYGTPIGGVHETIAALNRDQVRDFYHAAFAPASAFIVVVGDVAARQLLPMLQDLFGGWDGPHSGPAPVQPAVSPPAPAVRIVDRPGAPQSELRIGHAGPPRRTADYFALQVANTVLGGSFTSRLNMLLREEKAYTYGAGSSFAFRAGGGPFLASTAVFTDATADAVRTIVAEIGRMSAEPVGEGELERAKNFITLGLPRTYETTSDLADHVSDMVLHDLGLDYGDRYAAGIRGVTAAEVQECAGRWLRAAELSVVIAGDAARTAGDLERLGLGEVHVREGS